MPRLPLRCLALMGYLLSVSAGCPGDPRIQLQLCGDWAVPGGIDAVRVSTLSNDRSSETYAGVFELVVCSADGQATVRTLPVQLSFTAPEAPMWISVQGLRDGAEVMRQEVRIANPLQRDVQVPIRFTQDCGGVECPLGQTCLDGACVLTPYWETDPMSCEGFAPQTAAPDAGGSDTMVGGDTTAGGPCSP